LFDDSGDLAYDTQVRELAFDKRAKPKDRTKTEEEIALEEKEALEAAEEKRRKRMLGIDESDDEDERPSRSKRKRGGDDLEDDFGAYEDDEWGGLGAGLEGAQTIDDSGVADSDAEDSENFDEESSDEEGQSELEDSEDSEVEGDYEDVGPNASTSQNPSSQNQSKELPFTFPCPSDHAEFLKIVENVPEDSVSTVVKRIRTLHHPSLAPENKFKLQVFVFFTM
jgi:nucleolar protein 14